MTETDLPRPRCNLCALPVRSQLGRLSEEPPICYHCGGEEEADRIFADHIVEVADDE